jgi:hypothetical protein
MVFVELVWQLLVTLGQLGLLLAWFLLAASPILFWGAWWLWAADWRQVWPTLGQGGWAPLVLLALIVAGTLTLVVPGPVLWAGVEIASPWWQLGVVALAVATQLLCGWLQTVFGWQPALPVQWAVSESNAHSHAEHGPAGHEQHGHHGTQAHHGPGAHH